MKPSGVIIKPEPLPLSSRVPRGRLMRCFTSMFTTAGATRATALTTVREYASSKTESSWPGAASTSVIVGDGASDSASFKRKSIGTAFSLVRDAIVIIQISDGQTSSQLHMVPDHTLLLECYSPLARQRELFYTGACEKRRRPLPFWMRSVLPGSCSTELLTNGRLSSSRFWRAERCVMLRYSARSGAFPKKC